MINAIGQFRAKNEAAYAFVRELLIHSVRADEVEREAIDNVCIYLIRESKKKPHKAVDLNKIFRFVLYDQYVLVIPRRRFGMNDFVILKNFHLRSGHAKLIELNASAFKANPEIYLPRYLQQCLKRGLHNEGFEE